MRAEKKQKSLLIRNIDYLVTMDKARRILENVSVFCEDGIIKEVTTKRKKADRIIDASGMVMLPGFINTHHHLFQTLFRGVDKLKKQEVIPWVRTMSELTKHLDEEGVYTATLTGMAELLLSGCTTTSDFLYLYPEGRNNLFDATVRAGKDIGIRFHPVRGYIEEIPTDIWPEFATQKRDEILGESERAVNQYHDDRDFSMCQIALGPCGFYSTSKELFAEICRLARKKKVRIHTHFAESPGERISFLKEVNCLGEDVWLAHVVYVNAKDIAILAEMKTSVAYCPICNMAKKKPAPIIQMAKKGISVGIGVDGSAGNDSSNIIIEGRIAGRLQGLNQGIQGVSYLRATQILEMLTLGGAACLGRRGILGSIEEGKAADLVLIRLNNKLECAGAVSNPLEAIFHTALSKVDYTIVNGEIIIEKGNLTTIDLEKLVRRQNLLAKRLIKSTEKRLKSSLNMGWLPLLKT